MLQLNGRVFNRLQQYDALPTDIKREVEGLEQYLTANQDAIFSSHPTLKLKTVYGVKTQKLLEKIEEWYTQHGTEFSQGQGVGQGHGLGHEHGVAKEHGHGLGHHGLHDQTHGYGDNVTHGTATGAHTTGYNTRASAKAAQAVDNVAHPTQHHGTHPHGAGSATPATSTTASKTDAVKSTIKGHAHTHGPRSKQLLDALVLKGFVTPYKEDKPKHVNTATSTGTKNLDHDDNKLLVVCAKNVTRAKDDRAGPSVWDLVDGAVFAGMLERKARVVEPIVHGIDTYAVVNSRTKTLTLFKTDLSRKPKEQLNGQGLHVSYDQSHYEYGVKVWSTSESESELLKAANERECDALVQALVSIGASQRGVQGHTTSVGASGATMAAKTKLKAEKMGHDVKKAVGGGHHHTHTHGTDGTTGYTTTHTHTGDKTPAQGTMDRIHHGHEQRDVVGAGHGNALHGNQTGNATDKTHGHPHGEMMHQYGVSTDKRDHGVARTAEPTIAP